MSQMRVQLSVRPAAKTMSVHESLPVLSSCRICSDVTAPRKSGPSGLIWIKTHSDVVDMTLTLYGSVDGRVKPVLPRDAGEKLRARAGLAPQGRVVDLEQAESREITRVP